MSGHNKYIFYKEMRWERFVGKWCKVQSFDRALFITDKHIDLWPEKDESGYEILIKCYDSTGKAEEIGSTWAYTGNQVKIIDNEKTANILSKRLIRNIF